MSIVPFEVGNVDKDRGGHTRRPVVREFPP
jgi:hypothetical protein